MIFPLDKENTLKCRLLLPDIIDKFIFQTDVGVTFLNQISGKHTLSYGILTALMIRYISGESDKSLQCTLFFKRQYVNMSASVSDQTLSSFRFRMWGLTKFSPNGRTPSPPGEKPALLVHFCHFWAVKWYHNRLQAFLWQDWLYELSFKLFLVLSLTKLVNSFK